MPTRASADERFEQIYRQHFDAVRAYVRRRASADAVEDAIAETFTICWRKLDRVPPDPLPWLYAVARKTLANQRRSEARHATRPLEPDAAAVSTPERDPQLALAWSKLREADRELLALVAWEGLPPADAAAALGCSAIACRVRFHRAKRRLAQRLEELDADPEPSARVRFANDT